MNATANTETSTERRSEIPIKVIGFERRLVATVIDGLIIFFLSGIVAILLSIWAMIGSSYGEKDDLPFNVIFTGVGILISLIYYVGFWTRSGRTISKDVLGIQIISKDGSTPSLGTALLRYVGYIVSGVLLSLGFLWIVFDQRRQGWHDKIAGTYVVEAESEYNPGDPVRYYHTDPDRGWVWLVVWVVIAIGMPGLLLVSLWPLGASVNRAITNFLSTFV